MPTSPGSTATFISARPCRWQSMQWAAQGIASRRSGAIGRPQFAHAPYVPSSSRPEGRLDLGEVLLVPLPQGEVALLLEDLARGRRLRAVGHRVGGLDALGELGREGDRARRSSAARGSAGAASLASGEVGIP